MPWHRCSRPPSGAQTRSLSRNLDVLWYFPNKEIHYSPQDLIARGDAEVAFHTITGCDTASQFVGIGKQSALKIFDSSSKLIEHLGEHCPPEESVLVDAEAFVCQLYNHGTDGVDINEERAAAFRKVKNLDSLASSYTACELPVHDMGKSERVSTIPV